MPRVRQIFDHGLVLALKLGALLALLIVSAALFAWRWSIAAPHAVGAPPPQPLPFSHEHHVGEDGIDCRYCHTAVESSSFAGVPSSEVCMTCHSQLFRNARLFAPLQDSFDHARRLRWTRVHDLPDFVYFDHSAHVTHGVPCNACHGRVDKMPLTARVVSLQMQWCLQCHRDPVPHLVAPGAIFNPDARPPRQPEAQRKLALLYRLRPSEQLIECSICHR